MEMLRILQQKAGRFLTTFALAYALILQLVLSPPMAVAGQPIDAAICLSPVTSNAAEAPLRHHSDGLCQALCAPLTTDAAPETSFKLVALRLAKRVVFDSRGVENLDLHVWNGLRARGPPATV